MSESISLFSNAEQQAKIQQAVTNYLRLPFASESVPGALLEGALAHVRGAEVLPTYDFADVVVRGSVGWQVKSTKATTPVTWIRAKIPNKQALIGASIKDAAGRQRLGNAILEYCNAHAAESFTRYALQKIGYARLIFFNNGELVYFEKELISVERPQLFAPDDFLWEWSTPKKTAKKEQLPAFVGRRKDTGAKYFAWHGQSENQLHFTGEKEWWPLKGDSRRLDFKAPTKTQKVDFETIAAWLAQLPVQE